MARVQRLKATLTRREDFDDVPIKAPRVYREINEFYGRDTYFVTAIGLYQIWGGSTRRHRSPGTTRCADRPGRWAGRSPPPSG